MFRVSDEAGTLSMLEIAQDDQVKKDLLTDDDVYIINTGKEFIWKFNFKTSETSQTL